MLLLVIGLLILIVALSFDMRYGDTSCEVLTPAPRS